MDGRALIPKAIRRVEDRIEIEWSPTHRGEYPTRSLRLACPCAACVDEMTGRPLLDPETVPREVRADAISAVGAYGVKIRWSDGHGTGIYTYGMLLERCPCPSCADRE